MTIEDSNLCLKAFNKLCEELNDSSLVGLEECQYWLFERGYNAALASLAENKAAVDTHIPTKQDQAQARILGLH